jgi:hypothetical protein
LTAEVGQLARAPITLGDRPVLSSLSERRRILKLKREGRLDVAGWVPTRHGVFAVVSAGHRVQVINYQLGTSEISDPSPVRIASVDGQDFSWWVRPVPETGKTSFQRPISCDAPEGFWLSITSSDEGRRLVLITPECEVAATVTRPAALAVLAASAGEIYVWEEAPRQIVRLPW